MDEVENPRLRAAGESSPTLPPLEHDEQSGLDPGDLDTVGANRFLVDGSSSSSPIKPTALPEPQTIITTLRPTLRREASAPPPQQPPPSLPSQDQPDFSQENPDSLTLADLKRLRSAFPTTQASPPQQLLEYDRVYDFDYQDAQSFPVELEEWFSYSAEEEARLRKCRTMFDEVWRKSEEGRADWMAVTEDERRSFVTKEIKTLKDENERATASLLILTYVGLGIWDETAGRHEGCALDELFPETKLGGSRLEDYGSSSLQIQWIVAMVDTLHACGGLQIIYNTLRRVLEESLGSSPPDTQQTEFQMRREDETLELWCCLTLMYIFVEVARTTGGTSGKALKADLLAVEPSLLNYFTQIVGRLRWDESAPVPLTKMLLLAWKTVLVTFGGIGEVERVKGSLRDDKGEHEMDARGQPIITASPLDYHLFRQEINSKYPSYQPPPPAFPLEPENNSILPPLKHRRPSFAASNDSAFGGAPSVGTQSIMHQPVHIATPAPSPPPSPAGPGKAGKKQNYQTNQMFPFLYPPLDPGSNQLGGKGSTELQDALVGRRWEGSDIPASILEAAELFAKRMRATRAMKQMWEARVDFMKYERGWKAPLDEQDGFDLEGDDFELVPEDTATKSAASNVFSAETKEEQKLDAVNRFYRDSLPHLQSMVIVLLKAVLQNVTDLVTKNNGQNGLQPGFDGVNGINGMDAQKPNGVHPFVGGDGMEDTTAEELDKLRGQEISAKAISAILILLLKWFKASHILQYEYMTQLLLDSNYVPLILKLWQTQEIGRACHFQLDRDDKGFFHYCSVNSRHPPAAQEPKTATAVTQKEEEEEEEEEEEDDCAPPPIKLKRDSPPPPSEHAPAPPAPDFQHPPEVDELGYPTTPIPSEPLKRYSYRNLFTAINYLRTLQKITRRKTHRALLLVSYKSSNHLKKSLKIPVRELRYYTLKLYKSQVPFCGRKWRQGNMRVITAVWLSVPAELRDDWLSGGGGGMGGACVGDVDGTVEDALPLEQSLRALTHWWNVRQFPDIMGVDRGLLEEESDFFARELAKIELVAKAAEAGDEGEEGQQEAQEAWQGPIEGY